MIFAVVCYILLWGFGLWVLLGVGLVVLEFGWLVSWGFGFVGLVFACLVCFM